MFLEGSEVSSEPPLFQTEWSQFPQPLLINLVLQNLHQLCCLTLWCTHWTTEFSENKGVWICADFNTVKQRVNKYLLVVALSSTVLESWTRYVITWSPWWSLQSEIQITWRNSGGIQGENSYISHWVSLSCSSYPLLLISRKEKI